MNPQHLFLARILCSILSFSSTIFWDEATLAVLQRQPPNILTQTVATLRYWQLLTKKTRSKGMAPEHTQNRSPKISSKNSGPETSELSKVTAAYSSISGVPSTVNIVYNESLRGHFRTSQNLIYCPNLAIDQPVSSPQKNSDAPF